MDDYKYWDELQDALTGIGDEIEEFVKNGKVGQKEVEIEFTEGDGEENQTPPE